MKGDNNMKVFLWYVFPVMIVLALSVANIVASAKAVNMGEHLHDLDLKQATLRQEQRELDGTLAETLSLHGLLNEAIAQGYQPIGTVAFISSAKPVAMR